MDKKNNRNAYRLNGDKRGKLGLLLGIHDKNHTELRVGDFINYSGVDCVILYDFNIKMYWAFILNSKWYGDNDYDINSYGKAYNLPLDNGARMNIVKIS